MTIKELIEQLQAVEDKDLQIYACNEQGDNLPINSVSLYDEEDKHSNTNPLGLNY
ncbi:hypothetical protein HOR18_gp020 [Staphylococcus phage vB_SscM-1]|uniref:Uncharacterized protein n=2 Tax=Sciuriunavirus SscM1 TaxID=2734053 RepID=A0A1X9I9H9_9CAUD|nr:hypothetical protein HOR18_gp020 [Staphylococcus phage vB_SscM-1]ANT44683.1 hypothetical protein vB_SscM-1_020 [Staphylococcus phage vB_SscM-1]ANT44886.1 hypothetical protein vB_SscM-2_019 [Staphylococcus phage vB_SscM-2]